MFASQKRHLLYELVLSGESHREGGSVFNYAECWTLEDCAPVAALQNVTDFISAPQTLLKLHVFIWFISVMFQVYM